MIKSSKKPEFSVSLTTLVYERIFQYVALVFLYGFFWPLSTVFYEGLYWSLNYLLDYSVRAYLLTKKKKEYTSGPNDFIPVTDKREMPFI